MVKQSLNPQDPSFSNMSLLKIFDQVSLEILLENTKGQNKTENFGRITLYFRWKCDELLTMEHLWK